MSFSMKGAMWSRDWRICSISGVASNSRPWVLAMNWEFAAMIWKYFSRSSRRSPRRIFKSRSSHIRKARSA